MSETPNARTMRAVTRLMKIERERAFQTALRQHLEAVRKMKTSNQPYLAETDREE